MSDLPVLIIGAGISGLALAQSLLRHQIPFRIYERDTLFNQRSQGYRVRIGGDGIKALKSCLTHDLYTRLDKSCAQVTTKGTGPLWKLDALSAEEIKTGPPPGSKAPAAIHEEVQPLNADRSVLRNVLMRDLQPYVEFGKEFGSFEVLQAGLKVRFCDGSEVDGRLLVGADGASSRVRRRLVPGYRQIDTQGRFIYGKTVMTEKLRQNFQAKCLQGLSIVQDTSHEVPLTLLLEPVLFKDNEFRRDLPDDYVYWVILARKDRYDVGDHQLLSLSNADVAALARRTTSHWHSSFHALFDLQDTIQTSMIRIISAPIDIPDWEASNKVTLIGDAVHVMSPTSGVGAATALRDAAKLGSSLAGQTDQEKALLDYEGTMRAWASDAIMRSQVVGKLLFGMPPFNEIDCTKA
ncbi:hypothetical protein ACLMJK_001096 [Lecanora helva]